jgi:hypothetical protein
LRGAPGCCFGFLGLGGAPPPPDNPKSTRLTRGLLESSRDTHRNPLVAQREQAGP